MIAPASQHVMGGGWQADAVVLLLGTSPGRRVDSAALQQEYTELLEQISNCQPEASIICVSLSPSTMGRPHDDWWATQLHAAALRTVSTVKEPRVTLLELEMPAHIALEPDDWATESDWSLSGHKKVAQALAPQLAKIMEWTLLEDAGDEEDANTEVSCKRRGIGARGEDDATQELMLTRLNEPNA